MENTSIAIVGGGASGLIAALSLAERGLQDRIAVFERLDRVGKKLIATGNGQGNLYNAEDGAEHYRNGAFARAALARYGAESCAAFYRSLGILPVVRQDGRAYPAGLQASAVLDLMRAKLAWHGVRVETGKRVEKLEKRGKGFLLSFGQEKVYAERVLLAAGGRAAPQFGTDGTAYALAEGLGHTVTKTFPSLVQLTTEREPIRGLKGVKAEGSASVVRDGREATRARGEILFTDYGVSGNAVFSVSGAAAEGDATLVLSFLPDIAEKTLEALLAEKQKLPYLPAEELLSGILPKQLGRAVVRRAGASPARIAETAKHFSLKVTGTLGFSAAQVTRGGIPVEEANPDTMESRIVPNLFFAGEILDVDGDCGGYNLMRAYASARAAAEGMACTECR